MNKLFLLSLLIVVGFQTINGGEAISQGLKDLAPPNFQIGGVLHANASFKDVGVRSIAEQNFNAITASSYLPWDSWKNPDAAPDFSQFTSVTDWALARGMKVHGHVLVFPWANEQADWWKNQPLDRVEPNLRGFIQTFVSQHAGKIWTWDVVNEVMADDNQRMDANGLRVDYVEYRAMGQAYVDKAFHWAAAADPNARLILNTTGCERINNKSNRLYDYVLRLKARGVPVHGIGFQMHFIDVTSPTPDVRSIQENLQRFANAGFEIHITEMDVCSIRTRDPSPHHPGRSTPDEAQLARQKHFYEEILRVALKMPACKSFLLWDFVDDYSWLHKTNQDIVNVSKDTYTYPTPFWGGKACPSSPKPAYDGMLNVLRTTPQLQR